MAQAMADAHADGLSFRALGRLYGVAPSLVHRHVTRLNGTTPERTAAEPVETGAAAERPTESEANSGASEPDARPSRQHVETEFPGHVAGFEPEREPGDKPGIIFEPSPAELHAERRRKRETEAQRRAHEDEERERQRIAAWEARMDELRASEKAARGKPQWKAAHAAASAHLRTRPKSTAYVPLPSQTGVRLSDTTLTDRGKPKLWDNIHDHGPRGFTVVGS